jgi:two-component system, cell cycle sensor histidine kinase PleC
MRTISHPLLKPTLHNRGARVPSLVMPQSVTMTAKPIAELLARHELPKWAGVNVIVAASYFGLGWLVSMFFAAYGLFPAPIWLPTAIAMVAAIAGEWRVFPGIFIGSFAANDVLFTPAVHITTIISLTNALGPVIGALALHWRRPANGIFTTFAGAVWFLCCTTLLSPAVSATGGAFAMAIGHPLDWQGLYSTWVAWWLCDGSGTLYLAPALLLWLGLEKSEEDGDVPRGPTLDRQYLLIWAALAVISVVLFLSPPLHGSHIRQAFPFLLVVPLAWVALRMSLRWAYTLVSLVAVTAAAGTVAGFGPFQDPSLANPLQMVGLLVLVLAMNVLTIEALFSELHQAQRENRVKSMFLANTSHELRTPLNAILGFASMIDNQTLGPQAQARYGEYARFIHSAGEHLLGVINGLLDLSKIEAGQLALEEEDVALAELFEEATSLIVGQAERKSIALCIDPVGPQITLRVDRKAMRQVLINLLTNAVKFTPAEGRISLSASPGAGGALLIRVADTGMGIPADTLHRLFVPFERLHRATGIEGSGLGLCITRGLIGLHDGTIAAESEIGVGTTFTVTLPAERVIDVKPALEAAAA